MAESEEPRSLPISDDDVRAVVRLVGDVAGMTTPLVERRRVLITRLAELIQADIYLWVHSGGLDQNNAYALGLIDGGWIDEAERSAANHANFDPEWSACAIEMVDWQRLKTFLYDRDRLPEGHRAMFERVIRPIGLEYLLLCYQPLPGARISAMGLHRRRGRPAYTAREQTLVHLVAGQIDWLHHYEAPPVVEEGNLQQLSPRERQVLLHLLTGDGRKQIASKMGLSRHTVDDYCKGIFRRLKVSGRSELTAKFLPSSE